MTRFGFDDRWIDFSMWQKLPLSYARWWALPDVEWLRTTLPWEVQWVRMGDDRWLTVGGPDSLVLDWQWVMHVDCPWRLSDGDLVAISSDDEPSYPRVSARLSRLPGVSILGVEAGPGSGLLFSLSDGSWLSISPGTDSWPPESYRVHVWGSTLESD